MARSFPADTKMQSFMCQQIENEDLARLKFFYDYRARPEDFKRSGMSGNFGVYGSQGKVPIFGLPKINPMEYARKVKQEEQEEIKRLREEARMSNKREEMFAPNSKTKEKLYDGFSKEEKGRYQYLKDRKDITPEKKYSYPILSSWDYGWKLDETDKILADRSRFTRTRIVKDSFYTRNKVATLDDPSRGVGLVEKNHTVLF
jgi:hypothetical protein